MCKIALYIGAAYDVRFLRILDCKKFIHIDPSPNSEGLGYDNNFMEILIRKLNGVGYFLTDSGFDSLDKLKKNEKLKLSIEFENQDKILKYYINTFFPQDITDSLKKDISEIDTLIVCGFNPSEEILNLINKRITLVLSDTTVYLPNDQEELEQFGPGIIDYLYNNKTEFKKHIKDIILYRKTYVKYKFDNIKEVHEAQKTKLIGGT